MCPLSPAGAMQTPEAGADSASTVPLQTAVPVQPAGSAQQVTSQVPVQQQVNGCVCVCVCVFHLHVFDLCVVSNLLPYGCRPRLFNRFSMYTQHRCSMWRRTVASTPTEPCECLVLLNHRCLCHLLCSGTIQWLYRLLCSQRQQLKSLHSSSSATHTWRVRRV